MNLPLSCRIATAGSQPADRRLEIREAGGALLYSAELDPLDERLIAKIEREEIRASLDRQELDGTRLLQLKDETGRVLHEERIRIRERSFLPGPIPG